MKNDDAAADFDIGQPGSLTDQVLRAKKGEPMPNLTPQTQPVSAKVTAQPIQNQDESTGDESDPALRDDPQSMPLPASEDFDAMPMRELFDLITRLNNTPLPRNPRERAIWLQRFNRAKAVCFRRQQGSPVIHMGADDYANARWAEMQAATAREVRLAALKS